MGFLAINHIGIGDCCNPIQSLPVAEGSIPSIARYIAPDSRGALMQIWGLFNLGLRDGVGCVICSCKLHIYEV